MAEQLKKLTRHQRDSDDEQQQDRHDNDQDAQQGAGAAGYAMSLEPVDQGRGDERRDAPDCQEQKRAAQQAQQVQYDEEDDDAADNGPHVEKCGLERAVAVIARRCANHVSPNARTSTAALLVTTSDDLS